MGILSKHRRRQQTTTPAEARRPEGKVMQRPCSVQQQHFSQESEQQRNHLPRPLRWNQAAQELTIRRQKLRRTTTATHQPNLQGIVRARRDTKTTTSQQHSTLTNDGTAISATNADRRTRHNTCTSSLFIRHLQEPPQVHYGMVDAGKKMRWWW